MNINTIIPYEEIQIHLYAFLKYLVPFHFTESNKLKVGSGIAINILGRHFIGTAAHCLRNNLRVPTQRLLTAGIRTDTNNRGVILNTWKHPEWVDSDFPPDHNLDIGAIEIRDAVSSEELNENQIVLDQITSGSLFSTGIPEDRTEACFVDHFNTILLQQRIQCYQIDKFKYEDKAIDYEVPADIPSQYGFSGGGVFGVGMENLNGIERVKHKLFGINCTWKERSRIAQAVPIKHWLNGIKEYIRENDR
jgi:hypothetical protein